MSGTILALLTFAAWRDVATRTIPNTVSVALILAGALIRLCSGWDALLVSSLVAVGLFLALLPLHARGLVGGADLKLISALAIGLSPLASWRLLTDVTLAGGALAAIYLSLRLAVAAFPAAPRPAGRRASVVSRIAAIEFWRIKRRFPLPYGIAIAAGATFAVLSHQGV